MAKRLSITVNDKVVELLDVILTPPGFITPPKGSYSALAEKLMTEYLEHHFGADIIFILEATTAVGLEEEKIKQFIRKRR